MSVGTQPAIARIWWGRTRPELADESEVYNYEVGIVALIELPKSVQIFEMLTAHGRTGGDA
jgi:hypothetical protein